MLPNLKDLLLGRSDDRGFLLEAMPEGGTCVEIGVLHGDFAERILDETRPETLHLIDPYEYRADTDCAYGGSDMDQAEMERIYGRVHDRFADEIASGQVVVHRASSTEAVDRFDDGSLDWVYIDGDHRYEAVRRDLRDWWAKVRPGGYVTGDDYGRDSNWWGDGVTRAVDEFVDGYEVDRVQTRRHQFLLHKPSERFGPTTPEDG